MKSFLLSTLLPELDLRDEAAFSRAHPHPWLLREPTAWHSTHPDGNQTLLIPPTVAAPLDGTAMAIALEPVVRDGTQITLGRSPSCDLVIEEGTVSQVHLVFRVAPDGWTLCNGQLLPITQYPSLFAALGTIYGGGYWLMPLLKSLTNGFGALQQNKWLFEDEYPAWQRLFTHDFLPEDKHPAINITSIVGPDGRELSGNVQDVLRILGAAS